MHRFHRLFKKNSSSGFTMMEVLIVVAVITIITLLVLNNINQALVKARDVERQADISSLQEALEIYYHTYNHYPLNLDDLTQVEDALVDPSGALIIISPAETSDNKPDSSYGANQPQQQYTYAAYACGSADSSSAQPETTPAEAKIENCQKYVLYSWSESNAQIPFEKNSLH